MTKFLIDNVIINQVVKMEENQLVLQKIYDYLAPKPHLWEQDHQPMFLDCKYDHHKNGPYESWQEFMKVAPYKCNCLFLSRLWNWVWQQTGAYYCNDGPIPPDEIDDYSEDEIDIFTTDLLTLHFGNWSAQVVKIEVKVTKEDEPAIRNFLKNHGLQKTWNI